MSSHEYDIVVAGAGTAGCYAAATAADEGLDVCVVERKDEQEAGHIACGDALKGADSFPEAIPKSQLEPSITNTGVDHGRFEIPQEDTVLEIPVPGELAVIDRWEFGRRLITGAREAGATFHFDTVIKSVEQNADGQVTGLTAVHDNSAVSYEAEMVMDAAGALSILQEDVDLGGSSFDTNVTYSQFCSAYREVIEVEEPVSWDDALVFKATDRAAGYLWYFPRTETRINAGLGFQMNEEPMQLVDVLARDLESRAEFRNAEVKDKLGGSLPTRRPYDSAVAPGFIAVGDAAGHVNPTTGGGIAGAAYAATYAAEAAVEAISSGDASEHSMWEYNQQVMDHFGARYAALDVYNILSTAIEVEDLMGLLAALPGEKLAEALYEGSTSVGLRLAVKSAIKSFGHWSTIKQLYDTKRLADELLDQYESYPDSPAGMDEWSRQRDSILDRVYESTGAEPKY
jgi:geranylgeranyl reductase family